ncbi:MAG TPA: TolC family protein [Gemmatirosa sp.]
MRVVAGLSACIALAQTARAQSPPVDSLRLTRREAIAEALTRNPQIDVAREQSAQARARRVEAVAVPDPAVVGSIAQNSPTLNPGLAASRAVGVALDVPFPTKFALRNRVATADVRASESNIYLQQQLIASSTSATYDSLLVARRLRAILQESRQLSVDFLARTRARFAAGTVARLDVIRAQVDVAQSDNALIANERDVANAQASLNRLLGRVIGLPIAPADSLGVPPALPDSTAIERTALASRPEVAVLESQQRGAQANTTLLKQFWVPDLTFGISHDFTLPDAPLVSAGVALPLPILFRQHTRGEIAESQYRERELAASARDLRAQVTQDVRSAYANASTALRQVVFLRDELVPSAREAFRVASVSYGLGGLSALDVLDARRSLQDAETQLAVALGAANSARADLQRALGVPLTSLPSAP